MAPPKKSDSGFTHALRTAALRYPEAQEGIACKGTALECSAFKVGSKTFLFLSAAEAKLKRAKPSGWVTVKFGAGESPSVGTVEEWLDESYRLFAPKRLVALLPEKGLPSRKPAKAAQRKTPAKGAKKAP